MTKKEAEARSTGALSSWITTISILFMALGGLTASLICIFALPDKSVRPLTCGLFFIGGSIVLVGLLFFRWRKDKAVEERLLEGSRTRSSRMVVMESMSDKILKWLVTLFSLYYACLGSVTGLICIYALPDKTVQPIPGLVYSLSAAIILGCFIVVVWKNWVSE